ncbi:Outer membrane efflux protein [Pseudomonas syringae pv. syringae]|nr:Outer membrane efflux protein [Pseudomonas syringae pv. syringae]
MLNARTQLFRQQQVQQQVEAARLEAYAGLVVALGGYADGNNNGNGHFAHTVAESEGGQ